MTSEIERKIKAYVKERDEVLLSGDVDRLMAFHKKHNPNAPELPDREIAEITLHKARTASKSLPMKDRIESKKWLDERGYKSMDEGDLNSQ